MKKSKWSNLTLTPFRLHCRWRINWRIVFSNLFLLPKRFNYSRQFCYQCIFFGPPGWFGRKIGKERKMKGKKWKWNKIYQFCFILLFSTPFYCNFEKSRPFGPINKKLKEKGGKKKKMHIVHMTTKIITIFRDACPGVRGVRGAPLLEIFWTFCG